jgi:hypothetical protein
MRLVGNAHWLVKCLDLQIGWESRTALLAAPLLSEHVQLWIRFGTEELHMYARFMEASTCATRHVNCTEAIVKQRHYVQKIKRLL